MRNLMILFTILFLSPKTHAQVSAPLLQTVDTTYYDMKVSADGQMLIGLMNDFANMTRSVQFRTFTDSSFGQPTLTLPLENFVVWENLEVTDSFVYALYDYIKPIKVLGSQAAIPYQMQPLCNLYQDHGRWNEMLFVLSLDSTFVQKIYVHTLANPSVPQVLDTLSIPLCADIKVVGNKLYLANSDTTGSRVYCYTLSNTAPYMTLTQTVTLNNAYNMYTAGFDVTNDLMLLQTSDSLYKFRIYPNNLQFLTRKGQASLGQPVYLDSNTVAYMGGQHIYLQDMVADTLFVIDSIATFDGYISASKLGSNLFYATTQRSDLRGIVKDTTTTPTATGNIRQDDADVILYPNPIEGNLYIRNKADIVMTLSIFSSEGKLLIRQQVHPGIMSVNTGSMAPGHYYYTLQGKKGVRSGKLTRI